MRNYRPIKRAKPTIVSEPSVVALQTTYLALATSLAYLTTYRIQEGYLAYFGISGDFVELNLEALVIALAAISAPAYLLWGTIGLLPPRILSLIARMFVVHLPEIVFGSLSAFSFYGAGFSWFSVITGFLALLLFGVSVFGFFKSKRSGKSFDEHYSGEIDKEIEIIRRASREKLLDRLPGPLSFFVLYAIVGVGPISELGAYYKFLNKDHFQSVVMLDKEYVLVAPYRDGITVALLSPTDLGFQVADEVSWFQNSSISGMPFGVIPRGDLIFEESNTTNFKRRTALKDFLRQIGVLEDDYILDI